MISCDCRNAEDADFVYGDLVLTPEQIQDKLTYSSSESDDVDPNLLRGVDIRVSRWDNMPRDGKYYIPYTKHRLPASAHNALYAGIKALESGTCLRFIDRTNQRDYLDFFVGGGCYSQVGRNGGRQEISLGNGCWYSHTVSHEIMHALGFWHEQMRPDRDNYVNVYMNNVSPQMRFNFNKLNPAQWNHFGQAYDITSVMQYHGTAFSMNGQPTMVDKKTNRPIPWNTRISASDFAQLNSLYPCRAKPTAGPNTKPTARPNTTKPTTRPTTRPSGNCVDNNQYCGSWAQTGECQKNPAYMNINCKKACGKCSGGGGGGSCTDNSGNCASWAASGYCNSGSYAAYMKENCKKSCSFCGGGGGGNCVDTNQFCASWSRSGECQRNPAYMSLNCKRSCRLC